MEYFWWLYLATRLDAISGALIFLTIVTGLGLVASFLCILFSHIDEYNSSNEKFREKVRPWRNRLIAPFIFMVLLSALVPTKKDALFIAGGVGVIEGAKALKGSEVAKKSMQIVEAWLENNLLELQEQGKDLKDKAKKK